MALSTLRVAFQRGGIGRYDRAFLLRNRLAGLLREEQFSRFRTVQADELSDAAKIASRAPEIIKRSPNLVEHSGSIARQILEWGYEENLKMNSDEKIEERLAAHPFLKGIGMDHIKVLAQSAMPTHFEKDQVIFKAGEPANGFYLIESGAVALEGSVFDHSPVTTDVVSAGEPLGWSWLFPPYLWHFDARATEPTTALCFSGVLLRQH